MPAACPYLPLPSRTLTAASIRAVGDSRGPDFYVLALECAQALWLARLPAQSLLLINRAFSAALAPGDSVLLQWPLPYAAAAWVMRHREPNDFIGNPRRHYQHLATRMVDPRRDLRSWRAWACWAMARSIFPDLPPDHKQLTEEGIVEPETDTIRSHLHRFGLPGEPDVWLGALAWAGNGAATT